MHSKMEKVEISQQINEVIYKRFMEKEQDERDKIIKSIKKYIKEEFKADNIIQFEFTEGEWRVIGDKWIEAIQKLSKILQITYDDIVIEYPPEWENLDVHQSGTKLQYIKLDQPNHQTEFDDVKSKFLHQLNVNVQVETIERIQNSHLWENYYWAKKRIETKYKDVAGVDISYERLFFHATHFTDPKLVIDSTEGIDRRYLIFVFYIYLCLCTDTQLEQDTDMEHTLQNSQITQ